MKGRRREDARPAHTRKGSTCRTVEWLAGGIEAFADVLGLLYTGGSFGKQVPKVRLRETACD